MIDDEYLSLELNDKRRWWCVVVAVICGDVDGDRID